MPSLYYSAEYQQTCSILLTAYPGGFQPKGSYPLEIGYQWDYNSARNCETPSIDGRGDLLDFFPFWIDFSEAMSLARSGIRFAIQLRHTRGEMNAVCTDLETDRSREYLTQDSACMSIPWADDPDVPLWRSRVKSLDGGQNVPDDFLSLCCDPRKGIILCEGSDARTTGATSSRLEAIFLIDDGDGQFHEIGRRFLNTSISQSREMYRYANLRNWNLPEAPAQSFAFPAGVVPGEPANLPDAETDDTKLFFLHGFNVNAGESADWQDRLFKRLYRTGSNARYVGIDWQGDQGFLGNYADNVLNAFQTAPYLVKLVDTMRGGDKTILLAHSLGNMLACSAIQDHGLQIDTTCMLNAAIAAEAFEDSLHIADESNPMVPVLWHDFLPRTWSTEWHTYFDSTDNRSKLTWKNRFCQVPTLTKLVNYFDSQDEVLGIWTPEEDEELTRATGVKWRHPFITFRCYSWQKQEQFKGRDGQVLSPSLGCTDMAGWGRHKIIIGYEPYFRYMDADEANQLTLADCADFSKVAFRREPADMNDANVSEERRNEILAKGIAAMSPPVGHQAIPIPGGNNRDIVTLLGTEPPWPRDDDFVLDDIWSHSDFLNIPYFYSHRFFERLLSEIRS